MKSISIFYCLIAMLGWGCEKATQSPRSLPLPVTSTLPANSTVSQPVTISTTAPVSPSVSSYPTFNSPPSTTISEEDRNYDGEYPRYLNSNNSTILTYSGDIKGFEDDTIYFNNHRWNHWSDMKGTISVDTLSNMIGAIFWAGKGADLAREFFYFRCPAQAGTYRTAAIIYRGVNTLFPTFTSYDGEIPVNEYYLDEQADNWIQISSYNKSTKQVIGKFSLHFKLYHPKKVSTGIIYPNTIHMHGSFSN